VVAVVVEVGPVVDLRRAQLTVAARLRLERRKRRHEVRAAKTAVSHLDATQGSAFRNRGRAAIERCIEGGTSTNHLTTEDGGKA
jgi:hypothetical protein